MGELRQLADLSDHDESLSNAASPRAPVAADGSTTRVPATSPATPIPSQTTPTRPSQGRDQEAGVGGDGDDDADDEVDIPNSPRASRGQSRGLLLYLSIMGLFVVYSLIAFWPRPTPNEQIPPKVDTTRKNQSTPQQQQPDSGAGRRQPVRPTSGRPVTLSGAIPSGRVFPVRLEGSASLVLRTQAASPSRDTSSCGSRAWAVDQVLWGDTSLASRRLDTLRQQMIAVCYFGRPVVVWKEVQLLVLVLLGGLLGGVLHAVRRITRLEFQNKLYAYGLAGFYAWPLTGALVALVFYAIIRGGFFSPQASVGQTSTYSFIALALLAGMFPHEAIAKLKQIAETTLTKSSTTPGQPVKANGNQAGDGDKGGGGDKAPVSPAARPANERGDLPNAAGAAGAAQG